jgi:hypothetical protein
MNICKSIICTVEHMFSVCLEVQWVKGSERKKCKDVLNKQWIGWSLASWILSFLQWGKVYVHNIRWSVRAFQYQESMSVCKGWPQIASNIQNIFLLA